MVFSRHGVGSFCFGRGLGRGLGQLSPCGESGHVPPWCAQEWDRCDSSDAWQTGGVHRLGQPQRHQVLALLSLSRWCANHCVAATLCAAISRYGTCCRCTFLKTPCSLVTTALRCSSPTPTRKACSCRGSPWRRTRAQSTSASCSRSRAAPPTLIFPFLKYRWLSWRSVAGKRWRTLILFFLSLGAPDPGQRRPRGVRVQRHDAHAVPHGCVRRRHEGRGWQPLRWRGPGDVPRREHYRTRRTGPCAAEQRRAAGRSRRRQRPCRLPRALCAW